jgi:HlyD family secretion protein
MKRLLIVTTVVLAVAVTLYFIRHDAAKAANAPRHVVVARGNVAQEALALGNIVPDQEISVKSKLGGIVDRVHVKVGDVVKAGDPLLDVRPDPTPLERAEAERNLQIVRVTEEGARNELERTRQYAEQGLVSEKQLEQAKQDYERARLNSQLAAERLELLRSGRANIEGREVSSRITAPTSGTVLSLEVHAGDPVVPLTTYQAGTVLLTLADMDGLIFRGTVDEIDVGKLATGLPVRFTVGALPENEIAGTLRRISPKARKQEAATVFDVEADIARAAAAPALRAGYSTTARIVISRADSVLVVPERCVAYRDGAASVRVPGADGKGQERKVTTGLSDGLNVEIRDGLALGDKVLEPSTPAAGAGK